VPDGAGMAAAVRAMGEAAGVVERVEVGPAEAHWVGKATDGAARKGSRPRTEGKPADVGVDTAFQVEASSQAAWLDYTM